MAWSLNSRCYPRSKQAAAARSMSWMVTQRRCFAPDAQPAIRASLRRQTSVGWRGLGPRDEGKLTRRAPLRTRTAAAAAAAVQSVNAQMLRCVKIQNTKTGRLERTRRVAARPEAASVASDAWVLRPVQQRTRRDSSRRQTQQQQLVLPFAQISARTTNPCFLA